MFAQIKIERATPVLNTPDFTAVFGGKSGHCLPLDANGHLPHCEFVALPGMCFERIEVVSEFIVRIRWADYGETPLFVDRRFCGPTGVAPEPTTLPATKELVRHMEKRIGTPYVWGGNWAEGVAEMLTYYPPTQRLDARTERLWTLRGLDCSGLLFEATHGATPRNTSQLARYGVGVAPEEPLQPLDMIVYPGHVAFVLERETIIESTPRFGVHVSSLQARWDELSKKRSFVFDWNATLHPARYFTVRRFLHA